jgi:hypothetical protein
MKYDIVYFLPPFRRGTSDKFYESRVRGGQEGSPTKKYDYSLDAAHLANRVSTFSGPSGHSPQFWIGVSNHETAKIKMKSGPASPPAPRSWTKSREIADYWMNLSTRDWYTVSDV